MKQFLKWLGTKFSRHSAAVEADEHHIPVGVRPMENAKDEYSIEVAVDAEVPGGVQSHGPRKEIQMPNIYDCDDPYKQQQLKTLDESSLDATESIGVDPYNTGRFDKSKT